MAAFAFYFPVPNTPTGVDYELSFQIAGSSTPTDAYHDSDLSTAWSQPIVFNAAGQPGDAIYLPPTPGVKVLFVDENAVNVPGYPFDNFSPLEVAT